MYNSLLTIKWSKKHEGYASTLIDECINDAKKQNMSGVTVVTRKGAFMTGEEIFLKKGFK